MKRQILLSIIIVCEFSCFSQSKKEVINVLQGRVDSLNIALSRSNNAIFKLDSSNLRLTQMLVEIKLALIEKNILHEKCTKEKLVTEQNFEKLNERMRNSIKIIDSLKTLSTNLNLQLEKYDCWNGYPVVDTFIFKNHKYLITDIDSNEYKSCERPQKDFIRDNNVQISTNLLKLNFRNGKSTIFKDINADNDTRVNHLYITSYSEIDYFLIYQSHYESDNYLLIDKENGQTFYLNAIPVFSKNNEYFANYFSRSRGYGLYSESDDLLQIFEVKENRKVNLILQLNLSKERDKVWSAINVTWNERNDLLIQKDAFCQYRLGAVNTMPIYKWAKLNFK